MDGIIIINKPKDCTSHDVVHKVKKITGEKVGHTGTLDPMATGVLPLLIGKGTLCSKYLMNHNKIYEVQLTLGKKTDTADAEGTTIEEKEIPQEVFQKEKIEKVLASFLGIQEQMPPMYSAIKVNGKKLYEYARKGQTVEVKPRQIEIYEIQLLQIKKEQKQIKFQVHCSKGTYIRSLCEDIAKRLGTIGYMSALNRTQVGRFSIKQAIAIEQIKEGNIPYITIEELFQGKPRIELEEKRLQPFLNGVKLTMKKPDGVYRIFVKERFIGIGELEKEFLKRDIVLDF
ncbi:MAG: tRNA pseudouridine(55) synthase TruB [Clostridia bacterium]|nr:tRNA pseudouridine(55) synthase TruB [Clostridia bacterium]